jgi:hypothetical protein
MEKTIPICESCNKPFSRYVLIDGKTRRLKRRTKCLDCMPYRNPIATRIEVSCTQCGESFTRKENDLKRSKNHFCSKSCAATYNNKKYPNKRKLTNRCKQCNDLILSRDEYCTICSKKIKDAKSIVNNKLSDYLTRGDANRYCSIRDHARKVVKDRPKKCVACGYKTHIEVAHIKEIKDFPKDATIGEVNDPDNLTILCRNHHWEMDHNLLKLTGTKRTRTSNLLIKAQ